MFVPSRLAAAAAIIILQLELIGSTLAATPAAPPPPPTIDPKHSPSRDPAPRVGSALVKGSDLPALKPEENQKEGAERLRQRLAEALATADGKTSAATAQTLQIVNRREPGSQRGTAAADPPRSRAAARRPEAVAAAQPAAAESLALVPGSTARLAAVQRAQTVPAGLGKAAAAIHGGAGEHAHWAYDGPNGPAAWADLRPEFATCGSGQRQSPIDLRDGLKLQLEPIAFNYGPSAIRVFDTGHTVQVNVGAGHSIEVMGRRFELQQFHFHKPSEERIDGRRFDMSAHLVHRDLDGRLAIVAVLLSRGVAQPLIQTVWNNLPLEKGRDQPVAAPVDLNALLPVSRGYFAYMGSLTEPPCTEDVLWLVMKSPVEISAQQLAIFDRLYPMNARPVQATAGRMVKESD